MNVATEGEYHEWFVKLVTDGIEKYFDIDDGRYEEKLIFFIAHIYFTIEKYSYQYHRANLYEKRSVLLAQELIAKK